MSGLPNLATKKGSTSPTSKRRWWTWSTTYTEDIKELVDLFTRKNFCVSRQKARTCKRQRKYGKGECRWDSQAVGENLESSSRWREIWREPKSGRRPQESHRRWRCRHLGRPTTVMLSKKYPGPCLVHRIRKTFCA